jgi:hypothetical protein
VALEKRRNAFADRPAVRFLDGRLHAHGVHHRAVGLGERAVTARLVALESASAV